MNITRYRYNTAQNRRARGSRGGEGGGKAGRVRCGGADRDRVVGAVFVFLDGEYLGKAPISHFGLPEDRGHTDAGRVRVTVERLG